MPDPTMISLGKRQRQIYETVHRLGNASVTSVRDGLEDPPSYSTVRAILNRLVDQGWLLSEQDGPRLVYRCTQKQVAAKRSMAKQVLQNFFQGSPAEALAAFLDASERPLTEDEVDQMIEEVQRARTQISKKSQAKPKRPTS
ncbi:MAG TPA: BlaI/MecI/CopY family transcriptional regulator [Rhodopirellula baltica]|uniref:Penicillinase repressor n=1 Tax=Rhodopirellula baltica (strain DSM 10527 / NCIMB 13988 / SH1) TaxID=243090 RepID=Q7UFN9_RHOBA|nr:BlaI/MecI/CopY family transcriptional regulator [Rhodopirellula baltica]CAD78643.1 conserved hypothetical protein [Rhodopirellula baltica SH 1]HBE65480.1 BlaI/MecI/CopY family transcriptional regulator [Rhodopirellula baltica]